MIRSRKTRTKRAVIPAQSKQTAIENTPTSLKGATSISIYRLLIPLFTLETVDPSMTTDHTSASSDPPSISEATNDVRLSITPDLYDALSSLIQYSAQVDLPLKLGQAVQVCLTSYDQANQRNEIRLDDDALSLEKDKGDGTEPAGKN